MQLLLSGWGRAVYVTAATFLLLVAANIWARKLDLNPMTVAQNKNLMFLGPRTSTDPVYSSLPANAKDRVSILFTGNSQTYSVMDYSPGDSNMITLLSDRLNGGVETPSAQFPVRYGAEGNLRMSELLIKSADAVSAAERHPDVLICSIVLDGLRWVDARAEIAQRSKDPAIRQELDALIRANPQFPLADRVVESMAASADVQSDDQPQALQVGVQPKEVFQAGPPKSERAFSAARAEDWLQSKLDASIPLFAKRRMMYGLFIYYYLATRNAFLRLDTATRRPIPKGMYDTNVQLLELTLQYLREHGVHAVLYFAPIRPIEPNPYNPPDIERFRQDLPALCARQGAVCFDYSNLVPEEMWTNYPNYIPGQSEQRDFAHFTGRGHRRMAEQLASDLGPYLRAWRNQKLQQK
jgi:hypothetical protein